MRYIKKTQKPALSLIILLILSISVNAQWAIPEDAKDTKLPTDPTHELVKIGKEVYADKCISCHGTPGEGNNLSAINATELGQADFQNSHNAGEVYYKVNEGKGGMPSFKDQLSEDDKWCVIYYVKSFDKRFEITGDKIKIQAGAIELSTTDSTKTIVAIATIIDKTGNSIAAEGIKIIFSVKRVFGNLPIGNPVVTDKNGTAAINFPDEIPGDENGNIQVFAAFKDKDSYGTAMQSADLNWGTHLHFVNPVLERTLWGPNDRVPLWLLFSYLIVTGGVWITILYVVFQIIRIKKAGR